MSFGDYRETRAVVMYVGRAIITTLIAKHLLSGGEFVTSFLAIIGCFTAHSLCDDKFPDRNGVQVNVTTVNGS